MLLNAQVFTLSAILSALAGARPLDAPRPRDVARSKSYAIINVDGGLTETPAPGPATANPKESKTIEVVNPGPTSAQRPSSAAAQPTPAPAPSSPSSESTSTSAMSPSRSTSVPVETPKPIIVTVTVPEASGPTEYYDDGMWHTLYRIKTFEAVQISSALSASGTSALNATSSVMAGTVYNGHDA